MADLTKSESSPPTAQDQADIRAETPTPAAAHIMAKLSWFRARRDPLAWRIGAVSLSLSAVFIIVSLYYTGGELTAPIDDTYIHLQYGSQIGRGHFFQYNDGDPISTGASSFLYAIVLSCAYILGFRGDLLLPFATGFSSVCLALTASYVYLTGRQLINRAVGIWSGVLVAVSGPLLWGANSGMEVSLVALLVISMLWSFIKEAPRARFIRTLVLGALLTLTRPEGSIFAAVLCATMGWTILHDRRPTAANIRDAAWRLAPIMLPITAGLGQLLFYRLATSTFAANGIQAKSSFYDRPIFYFGDVTARGAKNFQIFIETFTRLDTGNFIFPAGAFFVILGVHTLAARRPLRRPLIAGVVAGLVAVLLSVSTLGTAHAQHLRYMQPFLPILILLAVAGIYGSSNIGRSSYLWPTIGRTLLIAALVYSISSLPTWAVRFGENAATIQETDVTVGRWIRDNVETDAIIAVKDVGAVTYFSGHSIVDTIGLTTNGFARASNSGPGTVYEKLRNLSAKKRPKYFAVYDTWPGISFQDFRDSGLLGNAPLVTFNVNSPAPAEGELVVPFRKLYIYRADWTLAGTGDRIDTQHTVRDYLNVGDIENERNHSYTPLLTQVGLQPMSILRRAALTETRQAIDSGRRIVGGEGFTAHNIVPGQPLTLVARTGSNESRTDQTVTAREFMVTVNGLPAGTWSQPYDDQPWKESSFTVSAGLVSGSDLEVELSPTRQEHRPFPDYVSYGYWFSQ